MSIKPNYRVGYAMPPEKVPTFIQPSFLLHAAGRGVDLIAVDPSSPLSEQGPFDCLVHKLYDDAWKLRLQSFAAAAVVIVIDPLPAVEKLHNRATMLEPVTRIKPLSHRLAIPRQVVVSSPDELKLAGGEIIGELGFPLIAKPLQANGNFLSHKMYLIFDKEGLDGLTASAEEQSPLVIQEFVNHGGVIFKVYVAGGHMRCVRRKSLPDISKEKLGSSDRFRGSTPFALISSSVEEEISVEIEMPPLEFLEEVARGLKEEMGVNLFNFDLIKDDGDRYLVIDVNYFPGYVKVPGYEVMLTDFFLDVLSEKEEEGGGSVKDDDDDEDEEEQKGCEIRIE